MRRNSVLIFFVVFFSGCLSFCLTGFTAPTAGFLSGSGTGSKKVSQSGQQSELETGLENFGSQPDQLIKKHIFLPETYVLNENKGAKGDGKALPRVFMAVKRQLVFSGVIDDGREKKALILDKYAKDPAKRGKSQLFKKGDSLLNFSIKDVGPNFVILAAGDKTMKLKLYQGNKVRPKPVSTAKLNPNKGKAQAKASVHAGNKTIKAKNKKVPDKATNMLKPKFGSGTVAGHRLPVNANNYRGNNMNNSMNNNTSFASAIKKAMKRRKNSSVNNNAASTKSTNPFLEAIRRAKGK